jgi:ABC-type transport system involved in multi-copper enzyme maturation permease subunit
MKHTLTVAKFTFVEVYRSKVMTSIIFLALAVLLVTYIASEFAYGAPAKIALDFGLGITTISNLVISVFIGSTLLSREIEQKTLYMILSRSISRTSFLVGKILGLSFLLLVNTIALAGVSIAVFAYLGGQFHNLILWSAYFSFLESFILMLFAVFFSLLTNNTLAVIYSIGIFTVGHSISETAKIFIAKTNVYFHSVIKMSFYLLPNFYKLNLKDFVLYNQSLPWSYLINVQVYAYFYVIFMFLIISQTFKLKNLD